MKKLLLTVLIICGIIPLISACGNNSNNETVPPNNETVSPSEEHVHNFSETYSYDKTKHWKECSCGEKTNIEIHKGTLNGNCKCGLLIVSEGLNYTLLADDTYEVSGIGECKDSNIVIPSIYDGRIVTSIGSYAFSGCSSLTSITIPNSLTSIGSYAFIGCSSLVYNEYDNGYYLGNDTNPYLVLVKAKSTDITSCEINTNTKIIFYEAFYKCISLTSITIPNSITSIGDRAFRGCYKLVEVYNLSTLNITKGSENYGYVGYYAKVIHTSLEESNLIKTDDGYLFIYDNTDYYLVKYEGNETELILPNDINGNSYKINNYAFSNCSSLTSIVIPNSVMSIGSYAFSNCRSLTSITIPNSITSIGSYAFLGCYKLVEVYNLSTLYITKGSENYGYVGYYAKVIHTSLEEKSNLIKTDDGYLFIYDNTDYYLVKYEGNETELILPNDINGYNYKIDDYAFYKCSSLTSIVIPNSITSIGYEFFYNCSSLISITIPNSVTSIGDLAFSGCSSLTSIVIPNSVTSIGLSAFRGCSRLTNVTFEEGSQLTSIGDSAFSRCSSLKSITIPEGVTSIGSYAFIGCSSLTSIVIPNSITSIEFEVFYNCSSLISITIPNSVTSIGDWAFSGCSSLTRIVIPNSVTSIGYYAFLGCYKLVEVYNLSSLNITKDSYDNGYIGYYAKVIHTSLDESSILTKTSDGYIFMNYNNEYYLVGYEGNDTELILPNDINGYNYKIYDFAFYNCSSLTSIEIPNSVTSIGDSAFSRCSSLKSITIPEGVTSIGYRAFSGCNSLTSIEIPNSVTSIGEAAFRDCSSLTSIVIPNSVTSIGDYAFYKCSSLTSIVIPNSVTSIGSSAFEDCRSLTSIVIPNSVTNIGYWAFEYCSSLENVYYSGTTIDWSNITNNSYNKNLTSATIYYYSETKPTDTTNKYWHYVDGVITIWE